MIIPSARVIGNRLMQANFTFTFICSGTIPPETRGQQRTCRITEEDIRYVRKKKQHPSHSPENVSSITSERALIMVFMFCQNLTDDECSEDKMNNLQFYLNKFPSAPDGNVFGLY